MSKFTNLPGPPPPPPLLLPPLLKKKYISKQNFFSLIGWPLSLSGVLLSGTLFFGIPSFFPPKIPPLDYNSPSQALNDANERKRFKKTSKLLAQRRTSSPTYLPGKPFGGSNIFGRQVVPEPVFTIPEAMSLVDEIIPPKE